MILINIMKLRRLNKMSKPLFNTDFEYDEWFEEADNKRISNEYFGKEIKREVEDATLTT